MTRKKPIMPLRLAQTCSPSERKAAPNTYWRPSKNRKAPITASIEAASDEHLRIVRKGPDQGGRAEDEQQRDRARACNAASAAAIIARARPRPLAGADGIADPHARRRAEAHRQGESDIVDREHRLEGARGGVAELGRKHHQPGEAGQLEAGADRRHQPEPGEAPERPPARAERRARPVAHPALAGARQQPDQGQHEGRAERRGRRGRISRADRAQRRQAEMAADPGPGEQAR